MHYLVWRGLMKKYFLGPILSLTAVGIFFGSFTASAAHYSFNCRESKDSGNDAQIELRFSLNLKKAVVMNYWGDGRADSGVRISDTESGQLQYKGFPHWVDDGVPGTGRLYVNKKLISSGRGKAKLWNLYAEDESSTPRTAVLNCRSAQ